MDSSQDLSWQKSHMENLTCSLWPNAKQCRIFPVNVNYEVHRAPEKMLTAFNPPKFLLEIHSGREHSRQLVCTILSSKGFLFSGKSDKEDPAALKL